VHTGEDLRVQIDYCKQYDMMPREVRWALTDGVTIYLPATLSIVPVGCHVGVVIIPSTPHMTPGRYQLQQAILYQIFPWRTTIERATSPTFTVLP
jgi:hypothetical protein